MSQQTSTSQTSTSQAGASQAGASRTGATQTGLSPMLGRLAAVALLLAVIGVASMLLVMPLVDYFTGLRTEIATERETLGRFEAFAANKAAAEALAKQAEAAMQSGLFLTGETDALRAANLQALINDVAQSHGVRLSSTRALPVQELDGLRLIGVQAEMDADIKQLPALILAFESRRPYVFIQSLHVTPSASRRAGSDELKVRIGIVGAAPAGGEAKS
jgi:hypothetical protein